MKITDAILDKTAYLAKLEIKEETREIIKKQIEEIILMAESLPDITIEEKPLMHAESLRDDVVAEVWDNTCKENLSGNDVYFEVPRIVG